MIFREQFERQKIYVGLVLLFLIISKLLNRLLCHFCLSLSLPFLVGDMTSSVSLFDSETK